MTGTVSKMRKVWEDSFAAQVAEKAYNTSAVESVVRSVAYYVRGMKPEELRRMRFLEMGCGAGPNLVWLAQKGIEASGIDISPTALELCRRNLRSAGLSSRVGTLVEGSVTSVPLADGGFDGVIESCVFQHLTKEDRVAAFKEVGRLLRPGGLFVGYLLDRGHTVYNKRKAEELSDDPGTLVLKEGKSRFYLTNIGLSHFFAKSEFSRLLPGFKVVDPCLATYFIPKDEALRRGYPEYRQSMWIVYAVK
ncbi:MAG: methyltransferase domain-containing protein [Elusimicrobia bacterium]|nr:methyltransferase domain-containing protein [Elusimicrobiota bacterium]